MKYSLRIEYLPGSQMLIANTLSSAYLPHKPSAADRELAEYINVTVHSVVASHPASEKRLCELLNATQSDPVLSVVRQYLRDGLLKETSSLRAKVKTADEICN